MKPFGLLAALALMASRAGRLGDYRKTGGCPWIGRKQSSLGGQKLRRMAAFARLALAGALTPHPLRIPKAEQRARRTR